MQSHQPSRRPSPSADSASRRRFLQRAGAAALAGTLAPSILRASDKAGTRLPVVGSGEYTYEVHHHWGEIPEHIHRGDTHGVCIDSGGMIYIKHLSVAPEPMDAIAVFDPQGRFVRSFGKEYHGGGHGIDIRREGSEEFLYLCDIRNRRVVKTNLAGEHVWERSYPPEPGVYTELKQFNPTNVAFAPDGGFYVGDGYGSHYIHQYDSQARWVRTFGGEGTGPGKLRTPHGLWLDDRPGRDPSLVVADRANARLQYFTLDGKHQGFVEGFGFPAHFDIRGTDLLVPDLFGRVTILNARNEVVANLGYDAAWAQRVQEDGFLRGRPEEWHAGRFVHPHDACYDSDGNIFVVEWLPTGRVSFLRKV